MNKPSKKPQSPQVIDPQIAELLKKVPENERGKAAMALLQIKQHSGPLPDAETIASYAQHIPNGGERVMACFEKQVQHRVSMETTGLRRAFNQSSTGQWMGFVLAICFLVAACYMAIIGQTVVASIIGGLDIVGLVTVFVAGRFSKK